MRRYLIAEQAREPATRHFYNNFGDLSFLQQRVLAEGEQITSQHPPLPESRSQRDRKTTIRKLKIGNAVFVQYLGVHGLYACPLIAEVRSHIPALGRNVTNNPDYSDSALSR